MSVKYAIFWFVSFSFLFVLIGCDSDRELSRSSLTSPSKLQTASAEFNPGDPAPPLSAKALDGSSHDLSELRGKTVLLNFWATWCAPCVEEMPALERLSLQLQDKNFIVVAVSIDDDIEAVRRFVSQNGLTFSVWHDPSFSGVKNFNVTGFPESFVIDGNGSLLALYDPERMRQTVRFVADRAWDTKPFLEQFLKIASASPPVVNTASAAQSAEDKKL